MAIGYLRSLYYQYVITFYKAYLQLLKMCNWAEKSAAIFTVTKAVKD